MPRHYLYRTTTDKLPASIDHIEASGHQILERSKVDDRHWVLLCRDGDPTVADFTAAQLADAIARGVRQGTRNAAPAAGRTRAGR